MSQIDDKKREVIVAELEKRVAALAESVGMKTRVRWTWLLRLLPQWAQSRIIRHRLAKQSRLSMNATLAYWAAMGFIESGTCESVVVDENRKADMVVNIRLSGPIEIITCSLEV